MNIGVSDNQYPEKRNILINPNNNYIIVKKQNAFLYLNLIRRKLFKKNKQFVFLPIPFSHSGKTELLHLFNEVAITRKKWIATFETELPRVLPVPGVAKLDNPELKRLVPYLLKDNCLGLIAISDSTLHIQMKLFQHDPETAARVRAKTVVMHPPQTLLQTHKKPRQPAQPLRLVFVGNEFYRKGGAEVVLAVSQLIEGGELNASQLEVHLIGDVTRRHNVAHRHFQDSPAFYQQIETLIKKHGCFRHTTSMNNANVLSLLCTSDVGLLPTWQETYGFSVLEMQASGCPVITSNVRALPEINPESAGWVLENELNDDRELYVDSEAAKNHIRQAMVDQLKRILLHVSVNPALLQSKGENAISRIQEHHDPQKFMQKMHVIYQRGVIGSEVKESLMTE